MSDQPNPQDDPNAEPAQSPAGEYLVVARRYRPQSFEELVGQQHVARALSNSIEAGRVGHAYLFTGARGVGKTSAARILAKALNCVEGSTPQPCNRCDICESIATGDDVDVLEIDGASNRGIDEIRELRQNVNLRPSRSRLKIYIIDEVHMLTTPAFNALLKTLEEPPEHVKFIFCTTEPEKVPVTIHSRCQRFDFAGIETQSIKRRLEQIAEAEGIAVESEALDILARRAGGSMRDSQSLLEQLLAFGGSEISSAEVHRLLGSADEQHVAGLIDNLVSRDAKAAIENLDVAVASGVEVSQLLVQLIGYFRDCLVSAVGCPPESFRFAGAAQAESVVQAGNQLGVETVLAALQILDQTMARLRYSTYGRVLAELALVQICQLADLDTLEALIQRVQGQAAAEPSKPTRMKRTSVVSNAGESKKKPNLTQNPVDADRPVDTDNTVEGGSTVDAGNAVEVDDSVDQAPTSAQPLCDENAAVVWQQVLGQFSEMVVKQGSCYDQLALPAPDRLVVSFREKYNSCKSFCERPERVAQFEQALRQVTGRPTRVEFVLAQDDGTDDEAQRAEAARRSPRQRLIEASDHPLVRKAAELLGAEPVWVEDEQ